MVKRRVWRHHRGNQNPYIEDEQTTQWSKEEFEDTTGVVRIFISKTNRQHNGQKKSLKTPKGESESVFRRRRDNTMVKRRVWRHHRGSQNPYIEDEETTQWWKEEFEDTNGVVRIRISKTNTTQWSKEEFDDTKGVVRIFISKTNRQHNGQRRVWRHQRGSQNSYIEDEPTTQWSKDEFEDTKGAVRIFISKTHKQHNGQKTSLKTPKGQSESLYRRRTENTMVKRRVWNHHRGSQNPYI